MSVVPEAGADVVAPRTPAVAARPRPISAGARLGPGVAACAVLAAAATAFGHLAPVIGAPVIAILVGITASAVRRPALRLRAGISWTAKVVLQGSVVVLGLGLSLGQVLDTGASSLPVLAGSLTAALAAAWCVGRLLRIPTDLRTLIGVGTAICGASAIAAADAVIDADDADVSYAVAAIFTCNVAAVLLFPAVGRQLGLSSPGFGLWAGTAINDLSSVVAATTLYGHGAAASGVVVKLTRTLAIIPIVLALAALRRPRQGQPAPGPRAGRTRQRRVAWRRVVPAFIIVFLVAVGTNTAGLVPPGSHHLLSAIATWMITAALGAVGLSTDLGHIRRAGFRPLALGVILWATVAVTSLALQALTGAG